MATDREHRAGIDMDRHRKDPLSRPARSRHFRHYAAEIRKLAEARPLDSIREQLVVLASQYDATAISLAKRSQPAARLPPANRRAPKRKGAAAVALP